MKKPSRRKVLAQTAGLVSVGALAGCSEDSSNNSSDGSDGSDGGSDGGDSTATPDGSDGDTTATPDGSDGDSTATPDGSDGDSTATPDGSDGDDGTATPAGDSGGDASLTFSLQVRGERSSDIGQFQELTIDLQRMVFDQESGDSVEVPVEEEIDLTEMAGDSKQLVDGAAFQSGTYTTANAYLPVSSATKSDGSDPSKSFDVSTPEEIDLQIFEDYWVVDSGDSPEFQLTLSVEEGSDSWTLSFGHSRY